MTAPTAPATDAERESADHAAPRPRDASNTRQQLLASARRRFAYDGYSATTVRDIAADAGVNVALINRYFTSKEGLFEACLARAVEGLANADPAGANPATTDPPATTVDAVLERMIHHIAGQPSGEYPLQLLLLLRSSGDERADQIRHNTLRSFSEGIAAAAGWQAGDADGDDLLLRAQVALATSLGFVLLRASTRLEPLASAGKEQLSGPLSDAFRSLLSPGTAPST
ncbi:MAG: hypothetical protein JWQ43_1665 [Glaciihabitans sp.]|nr:hypothetical protein [Glaciihabitans sp.]